MNFTLFEGFLYKEISPLNATKRFIWGSVNYTNDWGLYEKDLVM